MKYNSPSSENFQFSDRVPQVVREGRAVDARDGGKASGGSGKFPEIHQVLTELHCHMNQCLHLLPIDQGIFM